VSEREMGFLDELTEQDKIQIEKVRKAGLKIIRARGQLVLPSPDRKRFQVRGGGFLIVHSTPFNSSLLKTDDEEREFWRQFRYRLLISRPGRSCLDVYWNKEDEIFTRYFRAVPVWWETFLKCAEKPRTWVSE
jgi:bifunctional DNA-binding transcriptional regulator/antitoxin component of YhaV-PrlF toxin-antitoxin module